LVNWCTAVSPPRIADLDVTAEGSAVGEHGVGADDAVVRHVRVRHEQVVVADERHALVAGGAAVDGAALAEHVAVADREQRRFAAVFLVLRRIADRGELEHAVVGAQGGRAVDDRVRPDDTARTDAHLRTDDAERPDAHVRGELGLRRNDRARVDHRPASGATIMSACATS
jgi:hypothetical protein